MLNSTDLLYIFREEEQEEEEDNRYGIILSVLATLSGCVKAVELGGELEAA